jgi:hypothetical protein
LFILSAVFVQKKIHNIKNFVDEILKKNFSKQIINHDNLDYGLTKILSNLLMNFSN